MTQEKSNLLGGIVMEVKDIIDLETVKTNMNVNTKEEALKRISQSFA